MARFDVDYPHVREHADIVAVLAHYNITLKGEGEQRKGLCPFHDDTKPSLNVNVRRNLFKCHACGAGGNVIKLVQLLDQGLANPRRAALHVAELSGIAAKPSDGASEVSSTVATKPATKTTTADTPAVPTDATATVATECSESDGEPYNRPLSFTLKLTPVVDGEDTAANHFVDTYGLPYERLHALGIGVAERGSMKDRLAIPILNRDNELVAYCGRDIGLLSDPDEPKYKLPPKFRKDFELYGWNTAQNYERVILVESFLTVIKHGGIAAEVGDTGYGLAAVMGTSISDAQVGLLADSGAQVVVCFDGDVAGREAAPEVAARIAGAGLWVTIRGYRDNGKPHLDDSEVFCRHVGMV